MRLGLRYMRIPATFTFGGDFSHLLVWIVASVVFLNFII